MTDIEVALAQIREIVPELEGIRRRLLGVLALLPPTSEELDPALEIGSIDPAEPKTEIRGDLQCVLHDHIEPALRDLQSTAFHRFERGDLR